MRAPPSAARSAEQRQDNKLAAVEWNEGHPEDVGIIPLLPLRRMMSSFAALRLKEPLLTNMVYIFSRAVSRTPITRDDDHRTTLPSSRDRLLVHLHTADLAFLLLLDGPQTSCRAYGPSP